MKTWGEILNTQSIPVALQPPDYTKMVREKKKTPKTQHEFFYMYDKKIKRRCVHVIVEGYAVSLISGTRSKIPIFDEDKIREQAKSQTEIELKRDFLIRLQNINNSPTDGDCVLKLCYEIEKTRAEIKKLEGKKNA